MVDDEVARHREQPGPGCRVVVVETAPGPQQRLLHDILRSVPVAAGQREHVRPQALDVRVVQLSQPRDVGHALDNVREARSVRSARG